MALILILLGIGLTIVKVNAILVIPDFVLWVCYGLGIFFILYDLHERHKFNKIF